MNPAKAQFKADLAESFGREFEKMEDKAEKSIYLQEGARDALSLAAKRIGELGEHIDKEVEEGALEEVMGEPLKILAYVKKWLKRAVGSVDNLATTAEVARIEATGRMKGLEAAKKYTLNVWMEEHKKLEAYVEAMKEGDGEIDGRALDGHPGPSLKSQRLAEDAADKPETPPETASGPDHAQEPEEPKRETKGRLRPKKTVKGKKTAKKPTKKKKG